MKKILYLLSIYLIFSVNILFAQEKVSLQLAWKHQFQFAGYYIAKEKGFYKDAGLDVDIKEFDAGVHITDDVISEKVDFGVGRSSLIYDRSEGKKVVMLAAILQHSPIMILTKKRDDIKTIDDLKGKHIMLTQDQVGMASISAMFYSKGIKPQDYIFQQHSFNVQDLIDNKTDALLGYISNEPYTMKKQNVPYKIFSARDYNFDFYSDILFTSDTLLQTKPEMVAKFRKASIQGWKYALEHKEETVELILKKYNTQGKTEESLIYEADALEKLIDINSVTLGNIDVKRVGYITQIYRLMGLIKGNKSLYGLIYKVATSDIKTETPEVRLDDNFKINNFLDEIIPTLRKPLYDIDSEELPSLLHNSLSQNKNVQAIVVTESIDHEKVFRFYRNGNKLIFNKKIPQGYFKNKKVEKLISYSDEEVGKIVVYYKEKALQDIGLSDEEKKWIQNNRASIGVEQWAPVVFSNSGKDIDGIAGDFLKLIIKRTGLQTTIVNDKWDTLLNAFKAKKIDILPATYFTDERATYGTYSKGYFKMKDYLYVKDGTNGVTSLDDMHRKTLAIVKGYGTIDKIKKAYPDIKLLLTDSLGSSVDAVLQGKADALYEGGVAVEYLMKKEFISGLKGFPQSKYKTPSLYFFTLPNKPLLSSIIQKGLQSITQDERIKIVSKWYKQQVESQKVEIEIGDILPIKEILIAILILVVIATLLLKYLNKKEEVNLGYTMFIIVSLFLIFTILTTVLSISNLKSVQKRQIKNSLVTLAKITNKSLNEWYSLKSKSIQYTIQNSPYLQNISQLVSHKKDIEFLQENQQKVKKYYENIKNNFEDETSFFIVSRDNTILSASEDALIGSKIKQDFVTKEIQKAFTGTEAYIHPKIDKNDTYHFFRHLYFLTPLFNKDTHEVIAVYATGVKSNSVTNIANEGRIGRSGETYLINRHAELISNSRFDKELHKQALIKKNQKSFLNLTIAYEEKPTLSASEVLKNKNGFSIDAYKDYRGVNVFGAWRWDKDLHFGIITEVDQSEAMSSFQHLRTTIYAVVFSIVGFVILLMLLIIWVSNKNKKRLQEKNLELEEFSSSLEQKVEDRMKELLEEKKLFQSLFDAAPDGIVLISEEGTFEDCNKASLSIFGVESQEELLGINPTDISPEFQLDGQKSTDKLQEVIGKAMQEGKAQFEWLHIRPKTQEEFFAEVILAPFMYQGKGLIYAIVRDISDRKEAANKLADSELFVRTLLDSQEQLIITTDGEELITANETFYDFFAVDNPQEFMQAYNAKCICDTFNTNAPEDYLQIKMGENGRESWIDYVISRPFNITHKAMITMGSTDFIFSVTATKLPGDKGIKSAVFTDITAMESAKQEIEAINKHTRESIEYAALIQGALIPDNKLFRNHFQDYFAIWHPKDTVGGDVYLFEELRQKEECLLMVIDCTGHGVPGAFVTMLVKAIERQITAKINNNLDELVSPAKILSIFNKNMKQLLKQESTDSVSNAGFDGGVVYYNNKDKILKFAGAETPLFYVEDSELKTIKGNRYSVGYKKCDMDYEYKEHTIKVKEGMQFYLTTDGYLDQNGGEKGFPFGKKSFKKIIEEYHVESMADQQKVFLNELDAYQGEEERNDDVTLVGFKI